LHAAAAFMKNSPIKHKAFLRLPQLPVNINVAYNYAMMHYPGKQHWGVDNMWTNAPIDDLMPHLHDIAATLPPAPTHLLWLNWYPPAQRPDMAFSMENNIYIALYGTWKSARDTPKYGEWATQHMRNMAHMATGIQLADENLHRRTARFVSDAHLQQLDAIRAQRDTSGLFHAWHSRP
jgi:hypothetical protein